MIFVGAIDIEEFQTQDLGRKAFILRPQACDAAVNDLLAPAIGVEGAQARQGFRRVRILETCAAVVFNRSDNVTIPASFTGNGGLTQAGSGTLTVDSALGFSGPVTISAGTFALSGAGSLSNSAIIDNAIFDISGVSGSGASIGALTGNGSVVLGAQTLTLTAPGTFDGVRDADLHRGQQL